MKLSFRQGIVQRQQPAFLQVNALTVDLVVTNTPLVFTVCGGPKDYLIIEQQSVPGAWGPIAPGVDQWLYWDINPFTAQRTFGITTVAPVVSATPPVPPSNGRMWFDTTTTQMKVRQNGQWVPKIRVFACKLSNGVVPVSMSGLPDFTGTQVGIFGEFFSGQILFDGATGQPIKTSTGLFVTTEDELAIQSIQISDVKFAALVISGQAQQNLAPYSVVRWIDYDKIDYANTLTSTLQAFGIVVEGVASGQVVNVITSGLISNEFWDFTVAGAGIGQFTNFPAPLPVNSSLYSNATGQLTSVKPNPASLPVAVVVDQKTILVGTPAFSVLTAVGGSGGGGGNKATTTTYGITKISIPPAVPGDPIALGANDPRLPYLNNVTSDIQTQIDNTVKLTGNQTVAGQKTFTNGITLSSALTLGSNPGIAGQVLLSGGPGLVPTWGSAAGTGTVTSVGLAAPSQFSISNSPVISAGTLTLSWNTQIANTVLAGPATGPAAAPTFRTIVDADLPLVTNSGTGSFLKLTRDVYGRLTGTTPVLSSDITTTLGYVPGSVVSVNASGGTTGLTFSGGPVINTGTLTLGGTLAIGSGGTGQTTANAAFNALAPSQATHTGKFLTTDGVNTSWAVVTGGTVTSVGLSSSDITVGGVSPITTSGAWTLTLPNINANVGTFNNLTVNAKGQVTAASNVAYLTANQTITLTGGVTGSGTTSIATTVTPNTSVQKVEVTKNGGAVIGTRKQLNFIEGSNITLTIVDDNPNDQVDITIDSTGGSGTPGLPFNSIQFNNAGAFGGDTDLTWNGTTNIFAVNGTKQQTNGAFATIGDASVFEEVIRIETSNNTPTTMLKGGSLIVLPTNTTWRFEVSIVGRSSSNDAAFKLTGVIRKDTLNSSTVIVDTVGKIIDGKSAGAQAGLWDANASADTSNGALTIAVTGQNGVTIRWVGNLKILQVNL